MKTLKDLIVKANGIYRPQGLFSASIVDSDSFEAGNKLVIVEEELRQEAINWIKHYREMNEQDKRIDDNDRDVKGVKLGANYPIQEWIKHFFNIEESELK